MICQKIGGAIAKKNDGVIPKMAGSLNTDVERQAIVDARIQLAEALNSIPGLMAHFENLEPAQIDTIVKAVVIGFQASVHRQCSMGAVPF
jgi:hypothetical protein